MGAFKEAGGGIRRSSESLQFQTMFLFQMSPSKKKSSVYGRGQSNFHNINIWQMKLFLWDYLNLFVEIDSKSPELK